MNISPVYFKFVASVYRGPTRSTKGWRVAPYTLALRIQKSRTVLPPGAVRHIFRLYPICRCLYSVHIPDSPSIPCTSPLFAVTFCIQSPQINSQDFSVPVGQIGRIPFLPSLAFKTAHQLQIHLRLSVFRDLIVKISFLMVFIRSQCLCILI